MVASAFIGEISWLVCKTTYNILCICYLHWEAESRDWGKNLITLVSQH